MVKRPEDFINGNWRGSNGHEPGQWPPPGRMVNVGLVSPPLFVSLSSCRWSAANTPAAAPFVRQFSAGPGRLLLFLFLRSLVRSALATIALERYRSPAINHPDRWGGLRKFHPCECEKRLCPRHVVPNAFRKSKRVRKRANFARFDALTRDDGQIRFEGRAIRKAIRFLRRTLRSIRNEIICNL